MKDLETLALRVLLPGFPGSRLDPAVARLLDDGLAGVCLYGANAADGPERLRALAADIGRYGDRPVVAIDEEGGDVTRLHADTGSPFLGAAALGRVGDPDVTRTTARGIGEDLRDGGITITFAPCADVNSDPDNPVIGVRSFGTDPDDVAAHVAAWVEGVQSAGVAACAKHFPGHGDTSADSHLALPVVEAPADVLAVRELVPFRAAVDAGTRAVMTSHLVVPALDEAVATFSPAILGMLRDDLGFAGVIVTDALDMAGASAERGIPAAAVLSLAAGADLLCLGPDLDLALLDDVRAAIVAAVRTGGLSEERLADAARRCAGLAETATTDHVAPTTAAEQLAAARAAVTVEGELPDLASARSVRVTSTANIAVGTTAWGLPGHDVDEHDAASLADASQVLVLQTRDGHRRTAVTDLLRARESRGRVTVVVEWGWPGPLPVAVPRVIGHGSSQPSVAAVGEALARHGWNGGVPR